MAIRLFMSKEFSKFIRKEKISHVKLIETIRKIDAGLIDAHYGGGVIKQRISRDGEGGSSSYRFIILYRKANKAFFVYGFNKNTQENITKTDEVGFKKLAKIMLAMTDQQITMLLNAKKIEELNND